MKKIRSLSEKREEKLIDESRNLIDAVLSLNNNEVDIDEDTERKLDDKLNIISTQWEYYKGLKKGEGVMEKLYTPEEVAEYLHFERKTVMDYLRAKKIKGIKVGREWRVKESALQAFIDSLDDDDHDEK
ncbi:MAG: helix-turn-helix domain-containing protein [Candidatus Xenobiia bacterium LiM19]